MISSPPPASSPLPHILDVRGLHVWAADGRLPLLHGISFTLARGACLGIVGESGSGKTLLCRSLLGLLPPSLSAQGEVVLDGTAVQAQDVAALRRWRGRGMAVVLQQPMTAFDPLYTLGVQFAETLAAHSMCPPDRAEAVSRRMLARVRLRQPARVLRSYPHELSGGMLQRCMIALALALAPQVIIADEPTTALDAESQFEVLQRFKEVRAASHTAMIVVSHDVGVVQHLADNIMVMQHGLCVEYGAAATVLHNPRHPHTQELVRTRLALSRAFTGRVGVSC